MQSIMLSPPLDEDPVTVVLFVEVVEVPLVLVEPPPPDEWLPLPHPFAAITTNNAKGRPKDEVRKGRMGASWEK